MDIKELERLAPTADEMLSGLHADETMKRRILYAARAEKTAARKTPVRRFAPALCCAALAIACVGAVGLRLSNAQKQPLEPVAISSIAAGDNVMENSVRVADVGAEVRQIHIAVAEEVLFKIIKCVKPVVVVVIKRYHAKHNPSSFLSFTCVFVWGNNWHSQMLSANNG